MSEVEDLLNVLPDETRGEDTLRFRARLGFLALAWLVPLFLLGGPVVIPFFIFFPVGLFQLFGADVGNEFGGHAALGWILYISLCAALLATGDKRTYVKLFVVLCVLLILNTIGCKVGLEGFGQGGL